MDQRSLFVGTPAWAHGYHVLRLRNPWPSDACGKWGYRLELDKFVCSRQVYKLLISLVLCNHQLITLQTINSSNQYLYNSHRLLSTFSTQPRWVPFQMNSGRKSLRRLEVPSNTRRFQYRSRVRMRFLSTSSTLVYATLIFMLSMVTGLW
jgi:hypothetical protein